MPVPSACPLCNSPSTCQTVKSTYVYGDKSGERAFYQCLTCDAIYQYPLMSEADEATFYAQEFELFMDERSGVHNRWTNAEAHRKMNHSTYERRYKYLKPHLHGPQSILEVGCSSGFVLQPLSEQGHAVVGVEPSGYFQEYLSTLNIENYSSLKQLSVNRPETKYDLILHFFVLEHIVDPFRIITQQMDLLKDGGCIIFEVPNAADPLITIYNIPAFERFYWSVAHPWYFTKRSLSYLLDRLHLKYSITLDQRYDLSNHFVWAQEQKPGGTGRYSDFFGEELEAAYKQRLIASGNCDTLIVTIQK